MPSALIAGISGIAGSNLAAHLLDEGWEVAGIARNPVNSPPGSSDDRRRTC